MASNRDRKKDKRPMVQYYGRSLGEAYWNGMYDRIKHHRGLLKKFQEVHDAEYERHKAELEVYRINGKIEVIEDLFNDDAMMEVKEKLKTELVFAEAKLADKKVPTLDWDMLGEQQMWC